MVLAAPRPASAMIRVLVSVAATASPRPSGSIMRAPDVGAAWSSACGSCRRWRRCADRFVGDHVQRQQVGQGGGGLVGDAQVVIGGGGARAGEGDGDAADVRG